MQLLLVLSNYFSSVVAEMVYLILVEARNCVELSIFPRLGPSLFYSGGGQKLCRIICPR